MTVFSFHPVKSITTGEGGAVLTNNKNFYQKLILLRNHGVYKNQQGKNIMMALGYNYRLTDFGAALGLSQLKKIDSFIKKRRQIIQWYYQELKNVKEIILPQEIQGNYSAWHLFIIRVVKPVNREKLANYLKQNGVAVNFHYPAVYWQPYYQKIGYHQIRLKDTLLYQNTTLTLPCYPNLKLKDIKFISHLIKNYFLNS
jgi:dTDP-4-amino-4,6-dideoxygalactose transaminase